ncbi:hypothetical protein HDU98_009782 [Podochytrium sp. JEL0797]|nr:hypothetical protein HDU98_009782 [Podochytrium sp. JEL0797]
MAIDWTIIFPAVLGVAMTFQGACTAKLGGAVGPALATLQVFCLSATCCTIFFLIDSKGGQNVDFSNGATTPWYGYLGGLAGPIVVFSYAICIPVMGASLFFVINVSLQLVTALLLDNFGWVSIPQKAATTGGIVGICVVLASVFIVGFAPDASTKDSSTDDSLKRVSETPSRIDPESPTTTTAAPAPPPAPPSSKPKPIVFLLCLAYCCFSGVVCSLQAGFNLALAVGYGSSSFASLLAASTGIPLCAAVFVVQQRKAKINLRKAIPQTEWWCWTGGFVSLSLILTLTYLPDRIGTSAVIGTLVCTQVVSSVVFDHFGWLGLTKKRVTWVKGGGAVLLVAGVVVMSVFGS